MECLSGHGECVLLYNSHSHNSLPECSSCKRGNDHLTVIVAILIRLLSAASAFVVVKPGLLMQCILAKWICFYPMVKALKLCFDYV